MADAEEAWLSALCGFLGAVPLPATFPDAVACLEGVGVDVAAVRARVAAWLALPAANRHASDWRRDGVAFSPEYAGAIHAYTLPDPAVHTMLNGLLHDTAHRAGGPADGGISPALRTCLPFIKFLEAALEAAVRAWGAYQGSCYRGEKWAFPSPQQHDPEAHFFDGREFSWCEFKSSSMTFDTMYQPVFCGRFGPRTIFTIKACTEGVPIKRFSAVPAEEEVGHV